MIRSKPLCKESHAFERIEDLYASAFPTEERGPLEALMKRAESDDIELMAFYDDDVLIGFSYYTFTASYLYVLFLAVETNLRSKGYGSQILEYFEARFADCCIALDIPVEDSAASDNAQRIKRRAFYINNGFASSGLTMEEKGVTYEVLVKNGSISADDLSHAFKRLEG